jgi:predicted MPP superfamily phosphohydrolase
MKKFNLLVLLPALLLASCAPHHYEVNDYRLTMKFHDDFKVMQLTDLHFGVESNVKEQMDFVKASILDADPDLIILTGDNFMYSTKRIVNYLYSSMNEICKELTLSHPTRLTKFAVTYGNHDNQGDYYFYYLND